MKLISLAASAALTLALVPADGSAQSGSSSEMGSEAMVSTGNTLGFGGGDDVYIVVPGDTLWGIAKRFFGTPEGWPQLWSLNNDEVTNPHYIYPGQLVRMSAGSAVTPPSMGISAGGGAETYDADYQPVANFWTSNRVCGTFVPFKELASPQRLAAPGFLSNQSMDPLGRVVGAQEGKVMLSTSDLVYLHFDRLDDVNCGDIYTLYEKGGTISHPQHSGQKMGTSYRVLGDVRITDVGNQMATGQLVASYFEVSRGAFVTDRIGIVDDVQVRVPDQSVQGYIVGKLSDDSIMLQHHEVIYLDVGRSNNIEPGDTFWVVRSGDELKPSTRDNRSYPDYVIGRIVVFSADEFHATAVVTDATRDLLVGDRVTTYIDRADSGSAGSDADGQ